MNQIALDNKEFQKVKREKVAKPLVWFGIVSIVMLFAGLTSAVLVRKGDGNWMEYEIPEVFLWSTIAIVISSFSLVFATYSAKKNKSAMIRLGVMLTFLLGILFVVFQFMGYGQLVKEGIYFTGTEHNASGSFLYIISGAHIVHLLGGLVALIIVLFNAIKNKYNSKNLLGLQVASIYWHFLGGMWVYLYLFFRIII